MTITNRMLIALLLAFSLGCQQTNIEFTEHQPLQWLNLHRLTAPPP